MFRDASGKCNEPVCIDLGYFTTNDPRAIMIMLENYVDGTIGSRESYKFLFDAIIKALGKKEGLDFLKKAFKNPDLPYLIQEALGLYLGRRR